MIENLTDAFFLFLSFENIVVIFIGVLIGTIIGAIPGMTTPHGRGAGPAVHLHP